MGDVLVVIGVAAALVAGLGVFVFIGALAAQVTQGHRNPVAYPWIAWHAHHRERDSPRR